MELARFVLACSKELVRGGKHYWMWVGCLSAITLMGFLAYLRQLDEGLITTGMSDQVSWGVYIANFTFLVGLAAAAVMVVIPSYIFDNKAAKSVVMLAEGVAVSACLMAMLFVIVDLGRPDRMWHLIPFIGRMNWPDSMLSWDVIVLNGYLALNLFIPMYVLFNKYMNRRPDNPFFFPAVVVSIFWAISIHTVTAFLFSSNTARPFWHTALLGPRFLASAFSAGPAFIILAFLVIERNTDFRVSKDAIRLLALIATVGLQANLFMIGAELFTEFYSPTAHSAAAHYLFVGIGEKNSLVPWVYSALAMEVVAVFILMIRPFRQDLRLLSIACVLTTTGIWIEKGMGLIIPGFVPTPLGEVFEYGPSWNEIMVCAGVWAFGLLVFTALTKTSIPVELGILKADGKQESQRAAA